MTNEQRIVDAIQTILAADSDPDVGELVALSQELAAAVRRVNERLRECDALLHKGLRTEALRKSDEDPSLLELVSLLDFPERDVWTDYLRQFQIPAPPEPLVDMAADLNEAFALEQPLERLLRQHRLLALARNPLPQRIDVMRRIARADRANPVWANDLQTFERARHQQLREEVSAAITRKDAKSLGQLEKELRDPNWQEAPPQPLVVRAVQAHTQLRARAARAEMESVEQRLRDAFSDFDVAAARKLRERWNALAAIAQIAPDDPLYELAAPALEWLESDDQKEQEETDYQSSVAQLEHLLDEGGTRLELERLYHRATSNGRQLSPVLQRRLSERLRSLEDAARRRSRFLIAGATMVVLLIGSLTAFGLIRQQRAREIAAHTANLQTLIDAGQLTEAERYWDGLQQESPDVLEVPEMRQQRAALSTAIHSEQGRQGALSQLLASATQAGIDNPSWSTIPKAYADLERAEQELAKTDAERARIKEIERKIQQIEARMQREVDEAFLAEFDALKERAAKVDRDDLPAIDGLLGQIDHLRQRPHISLEYRNLLDPVGNSLQTLRATHLQYVREARFLQRITRAVGNQRRFLSELEAYAKEFPDTSRSASFSRVAGQEAALWTGLDEWNACIEDWSDVDFSTIAPEKARPMLERGRKLLADHGGFPSAERLQPVVDHLARVAARVRQDGTGLHTPLFDVFNNPTVANMYMVITGDGRRFYSKSPPKFSDDAWRTVDLKNLNLDRTGIQLFRTEEIANHWKDDELNFESPQSAFARQSLDLLAELEERGWERTFLEMLDLLYRSKQMEPILKLQLTSEILNVASQGSLFFREHFQKHQELIVNSNLDPGVNWIDPADADAVKVRRQAQATLKRMKPPREFSAALDGYLTKLNGPDLGPRHTWVGWLYRNRDEKWICEPRLTNPPSGVLCVVYPGGENGGPKLAEIATVRGGEIGMKPENGPAFVEGRPVYLRPEPRQTTETVGGA